jgi:tetratricopeptide (TPR) repeat protein
MRLKIATLIISLILSGAALADDAFTRNSVPRKWIDIVLPEELPDLTYPAYFNDLDKAELEAFTGRYKKSLQTLIKLNAADFDPVRIALVRGTSLAATGRREQAIGVLSEASVAKDPRVQIKRVQILTEMGKTDDALALVKEHLDQHPGSMAGHYELGHLHEVVGDIEAAKSDYGWFVSAPQDFLAQWQSKKDKAFDNAEEVTILGRAIDRWASLTTAYHDLPGLHDTMLNVFIRAYDVIDREYWPAHVAAAEYQLSHDNTSEAVD